jgi:hypothetical protein
VSRSRRSSTSPVLINSLVGLFGNVHGGSRHRPGLFAAVPIAYESAQPLGWFMLVATIIPISDAAIVLHHGGSRAVAFGVHGSTAAAMLIISGLLLFG